MINPKTQTQGQVRQPNERVRAKDDAELAATKAADDLRAQVASLELEKAELAAQVVNPFYGYADSA